MQPLQRQSALLQGDSLWQGLKRARLLCICRPQLEEEEVQEREVLAVFYLVLRQQLEE